MSCQVRVASELRFSGRAGNALDCLAISPAPFRCILRFSLHTSSFLNSKGKRERMELVTSTLHRVEWFLKTTLPQKIQVWFCVFDLEMSFQPLNLAS